MKVRKQSVVVFDGEDKFIKPRSVSYDLKAGKSEYVGLMEEQITEKPNERPADAPPYGYNTGTFVMPDPSDPEFCNKVKQYINTRGNGTATPDAIMSAYNAFNRFCKTDTTDTTTETTTLTTTETTTSAPTSTTTDTTTTKPVAVVTSPISIQSLGMPPTSNKSGKSAGQEKGKNTMLLVLLGIGVVGAVYYLYKKNK
jgi:hypothetical protein